MSPNPRTCIGCKTRDERSRLVRVVAKNMAAIVDERVVMPGRGAWIHPDLACLDRALGARAFDRALKAPGLDVASLRAWRDARTGGAGAPPQTDKQESG